MSTDIIRVNGNGGTQRSLLQDKWLFCAGWFAKNRHTWKLGSMRKTGKGALKHGSHVSDFSNGRMDMWTVRSDDVRNGNSSCFRAGSKFSRRTVQRTMEKVRKKPAHTHSPWNYKPVAFFYELEKCRDWIGECPFKLRAAHQWHHAITIR